MQQSPVSQFLFLVVSPAECRFQLSEGLSGLLLAGIEVGTGAKVVLATCVLHVSKRFLIKCEIKMEQKLYAMHTQLYL